jgi:glycosyltransferase involved in cell wall biosynthesis
MKFLLHAQVDRHSIGEHLGAADYSYFFLLRAYAPVLSQLGDVIELSDSQQADAIYEACTRSGEKCVLLSFAPPHKTPLGLACPTVPVFAWEYPEIPERIEEKCWQGDPRHDWRLVLSETGRAICLSTHTAEAVRRSMGRTYPIAPIPSPIAPSASGSRPRPLRSPDEGLALRFNTSVVDSYRMGLDIDAMVHPETEDGTPFHASDSQTLPEILHSRPDRPSSHIVKDEEPALYPEDEGYSAPLPASWEIPTATPVRIRLRGVVYTSVLTPAAGRKNWEDLITAFCWTFRNTEDATLILKLTGKNLSHNHLQLLMMLTKLSPFKCRVIAIYGYLSDTQYSALIDATTYYVNTSLCEGQCLPLVEFLNEGVPAIAPDNTAMADYIADDLAFVVKSYPGVPTMWPHGDNEINRTSYSQLDWESLIDAYQRSYAVAHHDHDRYERMGHRARQTIQAYCGNETVKKALHRFLCPEVPLHANTSLRESASESSPNAAIAT